MYHYLYKLQFDTAVRFGSDARGADLDKGSMTAHADTLFSALCSELALADTSKLTKLVNMVEQESLYISDLLPYYDNDLYLPKPIISRKNTSATELMNTKDIKNNAKLQKRLKNLKYVSVMNIDSYLQNLASGKPCTISTPEFGANSLIQRVSKREDEPLPYYVSSYTYKQDAGLYFVLQAQTQEQVEFLTETLIQLGLSGIGGKRSSGYGKFHILDDYPRDLSKSQNDSERILNNLLCDNNASTQMALSVFVPKTNEIASVKEGNYLLIARSGFISSNSWVDNAEKRDNVYMLTAGSCFAKRMQGSLLTINTHLHDVYRYAKGMFVGLNL